MTGRYVLLAIVIVMLCWSVSAADTQMIVVNKEKINNPSLQQSNGGSTAPEPICKSAIIIKDLSIGTTVKKGDKIQIPVYLKSGDEIYQCNENIGNLQFDVLYNVNYEPSVCAKYSPALKLISVEPGALTQNSLFDYNTEKKYYRDTFQGWGCIDTLVDSVSIAIVSNTGFTGQGSIALLNFEIDDDTLGKTKVPCIHLTSNWYPPPLGNTISGKSVDWWGSPYGFVCWEEPMKGDGNGDGKISTEDAYIALQMALGKVPEDLVLDMDNDGKVTTNDARIILGMATKTQDSEEPVTIELTGQNRSMTNIGQGTAPDTNAVANPELQKQTREDPAGVHPVPLP
jgi:hypothetical protein